MHWRLWRVLGVFLGVDNLLEPALTRARIEYETHKTNSWTSFDKQEGSIMLRMNQGSCGNEIASSEQDAATGTMTTQEIALDEKSYREAVETLLRLQSGQVIGNSLPSHAAILYEIFFKNAKKRVCVFCKNLSNEVFGCGAVVAAAAGALQRDVQIRILIQEEAVDAGLFRQFLEKHKDNPLLSVHRVEGDIARNAAPNFSVMDEEALRFEKDRTECRAFAMMLDRKSVV